MSEYKPNEIIIDKACELWVAMLSNPKFDALGTRHDGDDPNGSMAMAQALGKANAESRRAKPEALQAFAVSLKTYLMSPVQWDKGKKQFVISDEGHYETSLNVDYDPDWILAQSANEAGISTEIFPWKTNMYIRPNSFGLSYGYGAENLNYYPTAKGWLITTLSGSYIDKMIEYIEGGKPVFRVENGE